MTVLYEGKAKRVLETENENIYKIEYKDEVTAQNGEKHDFMEGKGRLNNLITSDIFKYLANQNVASHFIETTSDISQLVKRVEIIPVEVVVRNVAAGSIVKRLGFEKGQRFNPPLVEFYLKEDALNDPIITDDHVRQLGLMTDEEITLVKEQALEVNRVLIEMMHKMDLELIDFKIEFGKDKDGNILLADEISPDTCRIWDKETKENFDKDVYRDATGFLIDTYQKFYDKLQTLDI